MQENTFSREEMLIGDAAVQKLADSYVAVFGVGGVGGYVCEALARAGVGKIDIFDRDIVSRSNINRQIIALESTIGRPKTEVMRERILDINPKAEVLAENVFYLPENADDYDLSVYDYIADAVDTVTAKIEICARSVRAGVPVISAMGAGNKLDPTRFRVTDISRTSVCPLARVMRRELKARGIEGVKAVWSDEIPAASARSSRTDEKTAPGSISFVPPVAGLIMAGEIIRGLLSLS